VKRTILLDADIVAYKFAAATEGVFYFDGKENPPMVADDYEAACSQADTYIAELKDQLGATDIVVCLTDRHELSFRADFWPAYKQNRKARKPAQLRPLLDYFAKKYVTYLRPRLEADDCMGILSTHPTLVPGEKIIVSEDKDMAGVPGLLFNPAKDKKPRKITKIAADRWHLVQTITGDTVDNYPGARGVGPRSPEVAGVMAAKTVEEMWKHVLCAYARSRDCPDPPAAALVQARCARILRASDWNFAAKAPVLWVPPRLK
jgi:5'-3' exonuclease